MYRWRSRGLGSVSIPDLISSASARYGVPPSLALAVATRESGLNQSAVGTSGELGVFQLMPGTAAGLGVNPLDLSQNVDGGVRYLSQLYQQFGNWTQALQAYNGGPGNVQRGTVSSAAQSYADSVLAASGADLLQGGSVDASVLMDAGGGTSDGSAAEDLGGLSALSTPVLVGLALAAVGLLLLAVTR